MSSNRREFLGAAGAASAAALFQLPGFACAAGSDATVVTAGPVAGHAAAAVPGAVTLPPLPYAHDALEPVIDKATMELHHGKHHAAYVAGLNATLGKLADARDKNDFASVQSLERLLAFHGGGHINHALFWTGMAPIGKGGEPGGKFAARLEADFGSVKAFQAQFSAAATAVEGGGWAWLVWHPMLGKCLVQTMMNQQDLHLPGAVPLLGLDVWEHAYYLKYRNARAAYVAEWWKVVNWNEAASRLTNALGA